MGCIRASRLAIHVSNGRFISFFLSITYQSCADPKSITYLPPEDVETTTSEI